MDGSVLYSMYAANEDHINNCLCDTWDELTDDDRAAWDATASDLRARYGIADGDER